MPLPLAVVASLRKRFSPLCAALAVLSLSGCALSPQYVDLRPDIEIKQQVNPSQVVTLSIEDNRGKAQLGTRGGVYKDTSFIYLNRPIADSLRPAAIQALNALGLDTEGQSPVPVNIKLRLDRFDYQMNDEKLPKKVALNIGIHLTATKGSGTHEGQFNSAKEYSFMRAPSDEDNEKIINEILSETLSRLFNDQRLLDFIRQ